MWSGWRKMKRVENFRSETSRKQPLLKLRRSFRLGWVLRRSVFRMGSRWNCLRFCAKVGFGMRDVNNFF